MAKFKWNKRKLKQITEGARDAVAAAAVVLQSQIQDTLNQGSSNISSGGKSSPPGSPPHVNTGRLKNSIQIDGSRLKDKNPMVRIGTNLVYARINEFGGRIGPRNAKALAVPIGVEGRRASRQAGGSIRHLDLAYIPRNGKAPLRARVNMDGSIKPLFVLKKSVTIPARPYMRPSLELAKKKMVKEAGKALRRAIDRAA